MFFLDIVPLWMFITATWMQEAQMAQFERTLSLKSEVT
jgi:hypothetical protein